MMKRLILAAALTASLSAKAETITLGPSNCGTLKQCIDIPNDAGVSLNLYGAPTYPYFYVIIDGDSFKSAVPSGTAGTDVTLADAAGNVISLTYTFSSYKTCTRSGRGQYCLNHYALNSGGVLVR
jgi:hypothetical protein